MPRFAALAMPSRAANSPMTWPKPRLPSTMASVSVSTATVGGWFGRSQPDLTHSRYFPTRMTPCESWPTRFASTSRRAIVAASSGAEPHSRMTVVTNATSDVAGSVRTSVNLRIGDRRGAFEEVEIATVVRLPDVLLVQRAEAARVMGRRSLPAFAAPGEFGIVDVELQAALGDV